MQPNSKKNSLSYKWFYHQNKMDKLYLLVGRNINEIIQRKKHLLNSITCKTKIMKTKILTFTAIVLTLISCSKDNDETIIPTTNPNNVLVLKVDYNTNQFEGGKELSFTNTATNMTVINQYVSPADFGSIKLKYQELNETLFDGTIVWNGLGQINYPQNLLDSNQFDRVMTADYVTPISGFENVFNPNNSTYNYNTIWTSVQSLVKVRQYLISNPNATVKIFLYTPSVGIGNPAEWDWIIIMKN